MWRVITFIYHMDLVRKKVTCTKVPSCLLEGFRFDKKHFFKIAKTFLANLLKLALF